MVRHIKNPLTGRKIKVGGPTYKRLQAEGVIGRKKLTAKRKRALAYQKRKRAYTREMGSLGKACRLDKPCVGTGPQPRTSRAQAHRIARACGISLKNPSTGRPKTMFQLCTEIRREITNIPDAPQLLTSFRVG